MNQYSEITETIKRLAKRCERNDKFDQALYEKYDVKRGLRDQNGAGVVAGLTDISIVNGKRWEDDHWVSIPGELYYRGVDVRDLVKNYAGDHRGFEEAAYLLLFNKLPDRAELDEFCDTLAEYRTLPTNFVRDVILKAPNGDIMNSLSRSVLTLYSYDTNASDMSIENILRQCIQMIAVFPLLAVYAYQAHTHYNEGNSLIIHPPKKAFSTAENVLHMLRPDREFHRAGGARSGYRIYPACRTRRRKQFHFYHARRDVFRHGYVFRRDGGALFAEGGEARRRKSKGDRDVRRHQGACFRLVGRARAHGLYRRAAGRKSGGSQRAYLRRRARGLFGFRSARGDLQGFCPQIIRRKGV